MKYHSRHSLLRRANGAPKIKTCIGGWPNGTAKSSHLARNHSTVVIRPRSRVTITKQLGESWLRWPNGGKRGSSWAKISAWSNSSQLEHTQAKSPVRLPGFCRALHYVGHFRKLPSLDRVDFRSWKSLQQNLSFPPLPLPLPPYNIVISMESTCYTGGSEYFKYCA